MREEILEKLTRVELLVFAAEVKSKTPNDQELLDRITNELQKRNSNHP